MTGSKEPKAGMSARDKWTLVVLVLVSIFLMADQNAMNPVVREIMAEYGIDESKVGMVGSAFIILGALVSIFFGYFSDRFPRKQLFAFSVLLGEIPCFLTGIPAFTRTYAHLLFLRVFTGLGVGGIFPITFSLVGDYFDEEHRGAVNAIITASWGVGERLGQVLAGFLAGPLGWRFPFIVAAVPNVLLVPVVLAVAREPKRGAKEAELADLVERGFEYRETIKARDLVAIMRNKTNLIGFIQGIPGSIPWGLIPFFLVPFYENKGFSKEFATTLTLVLGIGATAGGLLGGWAGDRLYRKSPRLVPLLCAVAVAAGIIPGHLLMTMRLSPNLGGSAWVYPIVFCVVTGVIVTIPSANIKAMLLNVNPPEHRGSVFGIHNITDSVGRGIGPAIGGLLIASRGYLYAMLFSVYMWVPCAILYAAMALTIGKDLEKLRSHLRTKRAEMLEREGRGHEAIHAS